jgi:hypothetical protein
MSHVRVQWTEDVGEHSRHRWTFWFYEDANALVLDKFEIEERASSRHKFKSVAQYGRLEREFGHLREQDVPLTPAVRERALREFCGSLRVVTWKQLRP